MITLTDLCCGAGGSSTGAVEMARERAAALLAAADYAERDQ